MYETIYQNQNCLKCSYLKDGKCTWEYNKDNWCEEFDERLHADKVERTEKTLKFILLGDLSRFDNGLLLEYLDAAVEVCGDAPTVSKLARRIKNALL